MIKKHTNIAAMCFLALGLMIGLKGYSVASNAQETAWSGVSSWSGPAPETKYALKERDQLIAGALLTFLGSAIAATSLNRFLIQLNEN